MIRPTAPSVEIHRNGGPSVLVVEERPQARQLPLPENRLPTDHEDHLHVDSQAAAKADTPATATPAPTLRDRVRARSGHLDVLLFRVADESFAIDLSAVEEAVDIPPVHHVPEMPHAMLGVIMVRDTLTAVYSPAAALGVGLHDGTSALIFRRGRSRLAVVVDEVDDVVSLDLSLLRDTPTLETNDGTVLGVVRQGDALIALVDADALLAACQVVPHLETA
jgi:purine-binding chemotaxis protein CheW